MQIVINEQSLRAAHADLKRSYELEPQDNTLGAMQLIAYDLRRGYGVDLEKGVLAE